MCVFVPHSRRSLTHSAPPSGRFGLKRSPAGICCVLPPPPRRSLAARSPCEHVCTDPTAASAQTGEAPCAPMKAVSGNFTLSHACSHVGLPRANSLPVSAAEQRTRTHLLETLALNKLRRWGVCGAGGGFVVLNVVVKGDSNAECRLKRFIRVLRGF